jgi:LuxR family maltose regulon positive regulatory protein
VGFSRAIFDEVPRFPVLLRAAVSAGKLLYVPQTRYFKEFAGIAPKRTSAPRPLPAAVAPPREPLTERELAILDLLSKGLCNKSISRCSGITLNTIKWHLRNVFAKLDATSRTSAVARARELRLVD